MNVLLETCLFGGYVVRSHPQKRNRVVSARGAYGPGANAGCGVGGGHGHPGNHPPTWIGDGARDDSPVALPEQRL